MQYQELPSRSWEGEVLWTELLRGEELKKEDEAQRTCTRTTLSQRSSSLTGKNSPLHFQHWGQNSRGGVVLAQLRDLLSSDRAAFLKMLLVSGK